MLLRAEYENRILQGDCLEVMKGLPDNSVDAIVSDPPYGLGTKEPTAEDIERYLRGERLDTGGDFMGKEWDIPSVPVFRECFRVLKPGGYLLAFAGTRTWDIMSVGIRTAGFENRDTVASMFGPSVLQWVHGQGFPKSLDISKAIDKMLGAEREVLVERTMTQGGGNSLQMRVGEKHEVQANITAPASEEAKKWKGWGTALKPAWEPILCFRKPIEEKSVAAQTVTTGTGGINIDESRIAYASEADKPTQEEWNKFGSAGSPGANGYAGQRTAALMQAYADGKIPVPPGRWPANMLLVHSDGCKQITGFKTDLDDGTERVVGPASYECVDGCPVKTMDGQSGELKSPSPYEYQGTLDSSNQVAFGTGLGYGVSHEQERGDSGGASRFFAQFMPDAPFWYTAKASKGEVNADAFAAEDEKFVNNHPTRKPVSLMQWLVRLVVPKGGLVLDPFCGSGSTCVAATMEDRLYIGIERDPHYHDIATQRTEILRKKFDGERSARSTFDDFMGGDEVETWTK